MKSFSPRAMMLAVIATPLAFATLAVAAQSPMRADAPPPPVMPMARMAPKPAADMQAVLDAQAALGAKPIERLTPDEARRQPTPADGAKSVMAARGMSTAPDPAVTTRDLPYGSDPMQFARIYTPAGAITGAAMPVIVYYHGGGWVIANVDVYDATPRAMAKALNAIVVSVEYRRAPEVKFPGQHEDAAAAYRWVLANARSWGGDVSRMALAGESAGGNLAVATAMMARDMRLPTPRHILAVYPIANSIKTLPAKRENYNAKPLNTPMLDWFAHYWSRTKADAMDPRVNLVNAPLRGLPPVTIVNAYIDPLRSDGETLAVALRRARVPVEQRTFPGVTHEFFGMASVVRGAADAQGYAMGRLRTALTR